MNEVNAKLNYSLGYLKGQYNLLERFQMSQVKYYNEEAVKEFYLCMAKNLDNVCVDTSDLFDDILNEVREINNYKVKDDVLIDMDFILDDIQELGKQIKMILGFNAKFEE